MPSLVECLTGTERISRIFSDESLLGAMLDFEAALAQAAAATGLIPQEAAAVIRRAAAPARFDMAELTRQALRAGTPVIPLVNMLTAETHALDESAARFVHWGATSQDVADTALVLKLGECRQVLESDHQRLLDALRKLSETHASTVMLGRTLLQPAPPVTFGLKAAGWHASLRRGWRRCAACFDEAACLEFGGASGTLAALGGNGLAAGERLARALGLKLPGAPWHAHRDRLAALMAAVAIYVGSLGKMALDIALLMQFEVGEAAEPGGEGRGGSSTMPHKRNPTACMLALAAAKRTPGLVSDFLAGMVQEQERAVGGWQNDWNLVHQLMQAAGVALESMREVAEGLVVDPGRMRANIQATGGSIFAERARFELADENYLGSAEEFRRRLLAEED